MTALAGGRMLVIAVSARMLAELALADGHDVVAVDAFGDLDLRAMCATLVPDPAAGEPGTLAPLAATARDVEAGSLVYGAGFENRPDLVAELAAGRDLLGNTPDVLRAVRDPALLGACLADAGLARPRTLAVGELPPGGLAAGRWLRKPLRGGAGRGVRDWHGGALDGEQMLQERIDGRDCSISAVGDGRGAVVLGLTEQLTGRLAFGVRGYRWCGNVTPPGIAQHEREALLGQAREICSCLARSFGLRGVFGVDVVWDGRRAWVLEVNPRAGASLEAIELQSPVGAFGAHVAAFTGELPQVDVERAWAMGTAGKAIVFATGAAVAGDTAAWLGDDVRDVPNPGTPIAPGDPVCTVLATGGDPPAVIRRLERRAAAVQARLADWAVARA